MPTAEAARQQASARRPRVSTEEAIALDRDWQAARCAPDSHADPAGLDGLDWLPAQVPGTAAAVLRDAGLLSSGADCDLDAEDWWFRTSFSAAAAVEHEEIALQIGGIATVSEVFLNGEKLLESQSMFAPHALRVTGHLQQQNELAICCRALAPLLAQSRRPRARWRQNVVDGNLRFFRTMLLGRAPGFAPGPAAVGPWRPIRLIRRRVVSIEDLRLRTSLASDDPQAAGLLDVRARVRALDGGPLQSAQLELSGPSGAHVVALQLTPESDGCALAEGRLRVDAVARWWPHTHGEPALHQVRLRVRAQAGEAIADAGHVGFRAIAPGASLTHDVMRDGLDMHVNGVQIFVRGAVWTPADPIGLAPEQSTLRATLERVRDAGMNMLRIPGTAAYESPEFHDLCDELGLLVWQDFMFANLDYPISDEGFRLTVQAEAHAQLEAIADRPSLAVLCGNSEIEQQVAMLGLDPELGRGELFGELLPRLAAEAQADAVYVPSAPCGGTLPFRPAEGIANYYGVGGYRRPLEDARRAEVRFAAECLAFSNVPDEAGVEAVAGAAGGVVVHHPRWKAGVPRDRGVGWDFEDVRDHYLQLLYGVEAAELRRVDHERYLELSRAVTGETMAETFGEWRRRRSPCGGALVLWLADLAPGAGWGILDHRGLPKPCYHHLRRALAPVAVWTTDEGLGGVRVHLANDSERPLAARLRLALYRDCEQRVEQAVEDVALEPHSVDERDAEAMLGRFVDASWSYRFGPPAHDVLVATLERERLGGGLETISQAFRFPAGRPLQRQSAARLGLQGTLTPQDDGSQELTLLSRRLAYGVRIHAQGMRACDDSLMLEPGVERAIALIPESPDSVERPPVAPSALNLDGRCPPVALSALNLDGRVRVA